MNPPEPSTLQKCAAFFAVLLPVVACALTGWRFCKQDKGSWQLTACFAGLVIATSLVLLVASERISLLRFGDVVVQVNEKLEETRRLNEQNKRIAKASADLATLLARPFRAGTVDTAKRWTGIRQSAAELLTEAGFSTTEITAKLKEMDDYVELLKMEEALPK